MHTRVSIIPVLLVAGGVELKELKCVHELLEKNKSSLDTIIVKIGQLNDTTQVLMEEKKKQKDLWTVQSKAKGDGKSVTLWMIGEGGITY